MKSKPGGSVAQRIEVRDPDNFTAPDDRALALKTIESGGILYLPETGFELTQREREVILDTSATLPTRKERKSVNGRPTVVFDPVDGKFLRTRMRPATRTELGAMMMRFSRWAEALVERLLPAYAGNVVRDRITFRPCERSQPQGLHVDASYGHPTEGRGMLRVFSNISPTQRPRGWRVGEDFETFARRFLPKAKFRRTNPLEHWLARLGITKGERTPYDHLMADIRHQAKCDGAYQKDCSWQVVEFPAGSTWIALTDLVLHGALSGQYSLDQTFFVPVTTMSEPDRSSLKILERLSQRPLLV